MRKIAFYGGTFDPVHGGHVAVAKALHELFSLDTFFFVPAYHAPHKPDSEPTNAYHRYAMLCLAVKDDPVFRVSLMEIETETKRYTIDTLAEIRKNHPNDQTFFVMGADSWTDIRTWKDWEQVLLSGNHIVVSRPGYDIKTSHVTDAVRSRIIDLRDLESSVASKQIRSVAEDEHIFLTDTVNFDISATEIRDDVRTDSVLDRTDDVPMEVAKYIEKYELYR